MKKILEKINILSLYYRREFVCFLAGFIIGLIV